MSEPTDPNQPNHEPAPEGAASDPGESTDNVPAVTPQATPQATPQWPSAPGPVTGGAFDPQQGLPAPPPPLPTYGPTPQTSNSAVAALVLAIVSWVFCPVIPAIIALVFANKAEKEIAISNGWVTGGGLVTASKIVAWINMGLYAALIAIGILIFLIAAISGALGSV